VVRVGSRVPPARRALFTSRLVRATGGPTAGTPPDAVP
jgi:hypothetical protein